LKAFKEKSKANIDCCAGAVDGLLVWTLKPSYLDCISLGFQEGKFFCGRKHKFGLNLMGVCDAECRFLDIDISHPASTSDHLVFSTSLLYHRLNEPNPTTGYSFLAKGLCLFGDNAYVNTEYMATPYSHTDLTYNQDNYNFYHSQLRIRIEMAFGMLVRRFGILHRQFHPKIPISSVIAMTMAMCRLHNYLIDERETTVKETTSGRLTADIPNNSSSDELDIISTGIRFYSTMLAKNLPTELLDGGYHYDNWGVRFNLYRNMLDQNDPALPRQQICSFIDKKELARPAYNISHNKKRLRKRKSGSSIQDRSV
jgi:hypothetical protein